jgi:hypothetical protein
MVAFYGGRQKIKFWEAALFVTYSKIAGTSGKDKE